jgi:hypothetical protein
MLTFTPNIARDIVDQCHPDFKTVSSTIVNTGRWSIHYEDIVCHLPTGKHYLAEYQVGATEIQDERPFEYHDGDVTFQEVVEKEILVKKWVLV